MTSKQFLRATGMANSSGATPISSATEYDPISKRDACFVTASVVDPFGNILGIMYNPHYPEMIQSHTA